MTAVNYNSAVKAIYASLSVIFKHAVREFDFHRVPYDHGTIGTRATVFEFKVYKVDVSCFIWGIT